MVLVLLKVKVLAPFIVTLSAPLKLTNGPAILPLTEKVPLGLMPTDAQLPLFNAAVAVSVTLAVILIAIALPVCAGFALIASKASFKVA